MKYIPVIGLEVHVELNTLSKMFCGCSTNYFGDKPNTHCCPVCLGMPGALPVANKKAIEWCMKIGLALNCQLRLEAKFDRKNYFYPDLSKGYQISQYDQPFAENGSLKLTSGKIIRIRRVHMEEDTGKLMHEEINGEKVSLIDFNRSGIPLVEIVTEPDFDNPQDVKEYLQKLQQIVRFLEVSNADMEKGDMRLEPNISLKKEGEESLPKYKVEVKNINSFRFVEKAISFEITRQEALLENGKIPPQETRGWDEKKQQTVLQRVKEEANDYRYFPEPDIPPFIWSDDYIALLKKQMPELPEQKHNRFIKDYQLSSYDAEILIREKEIAFFFEETVKENNKHIEKKEPATSNKTLANWIINKKVDIATTSPIAFISHILATTQNDSIDEKELEELIKKVLVDNKKAVEDYKSGKENVMMFLIGQILKQSKAKLPIELLKEKILQLL